MFLKLLFLAVLFTASQPLGLAMSLRTSAIEILIGFFYSFIKFTVSSSEQEGDSASVPASLLEEQIKQRSSIVFNIDEDDYLVRHFYKKNGVLPFFVENGEELALI